MDYKLVPIAENNVELWAKKETKTDSEGKTLDVWVCEKSYGADVAKVLTLKNGFEVVATSACLDSENYDEAKGVPLARKRALDKVWELEGYLLR